MSKAFTRENDDADSETPPIRAEVMTGGRRYMTAHGAECFRQQLAALDVRRQQREEQGTSDEDDRQELRRINVRRQAIAEILARAEVVANADGPASEVRFGLSVTVQDERGLEEEYRLVGVDEVDLADDSISWLSPLAQALMGKKAGDVVRFQAPAGEKVLRIVRLRHAVS